MFHKISVILVLLVSACSCCEYAHIDMMHTMCVFAPRMCASRNWPQMSSSSVIGEASLRRFFLSDKKGQLKISLLVIRGKITLLRWHRSKNNDCLSDNEINGWFAPLTMRTRITLLQWQRWQRLYFLSYNRAKYSLFQWQWGGKILCQWQWHKWLICFKNNETKNNHCFSDNEIDVWFWSIIGFYKINCAWQFKSLYPNLTYLC